MIAGVLPGLVTALHLHDIRPSLLLGDQVTVTPQTLQNPLLVLAQLRRAGLRELLHVETPSVRTAAEGLSTFRWRDLHIDHESIVVSGDHRVE